MWQLIINGPGYFDTTYDLPEGVTTLGRADENDIVLSGDLVSRKHARISARGDALEVEDLGSRNGSKLNGQPLQGTAALKTGDTFAIGENTVSVRQASTVENAATEMLNLSAGGVRRFGGGMDVHDAVIVSRNVKDSVVMRALDNVLPFGDPFGDESPAPVAEKERRGNEPLAYESLVVLYKAAEALGTAASLQEFLDATVDRVMDRVQATTAVVLLRHPTGALVPRAVRHRGKLNQGEVPVSDAIVTEALTQGAAIAVSDVRDDARFAGRESVLLYGVGQVLCVPLGEKDPAAGVLYLNRQAGEQAELEELLDLCTAISHLMSTGVARFSSEDRGRNHDRVRQLLEQHHPPEVVQKRLTEIGHEPAALGRLEVRNVTVLVGTLPAFNPLLQRTDAVVAGELLGELYARMSGAVFSFEGTVAQFGGDSFVAVFGAPYPRGDDALRAVRAALALRAEWAKVNRRRGPDARAELQLALHTGPVLTGLIGQEPRLSFTASGEAVSFATALSGAANPGQVVVSSKTLAQIGARFDVTPLGDRVLRPGLKAPLFEVLEEDVPLHTHPGVR